MNDIEKIKAEIKRLMKETDDSQFGIGGRCMCRIILDFINSLPEEKLSEDLNKLIQKWDRIDINTILKVKVKATGKVIDGFYDGRGHFDHFIDHDVFDRYSIDEVELMPDEEPSDELEEAAENCVWNSIDSNDQTLVPKFIPLLLSLFISGAYWQKKQMTKVSEEDALLLERAWLTLDNFGYEELAERLRKLKEKTC